MSYTKKKGTITVDSGPYLVQESKTYFYDGKFGADIDYKRCVMDVSLDGSLFRKENPKKSVVDVWTNVSYDL